MPFLSFQPPAASTLMLAVIAAVFAAYMLRQSYEPSLRLIGLAFLSLTVAQGFAVGLHIVGSHQTVLFNGAERILVHATLLLCIQFAYRFKGRPFPREDRLVGAISAIGWLVLTAMTVTILARTPWRYPLAWESALFPAEALWSVAVFVRKARLFESETTGRPRFFRLTDARARAMRALTIWITMIVVPGAFSALAYQGRIDYQAFYAGYVGLQFAAHAYFLSVLFRFGADSASIVAKVTAIALMVVLGMFGATSLTIQTRSSMVRDAGIVLPERQRVRLTPAERGYQVTSSPSAFVALPSPGARALAGDAERITLPFEFPFAGGSHRELWVLEDGLLAVSPVQTLAPSQPRRLPDVPVIAPLYAEYNVAYGGAVHVEVYSDRLVVTWSDVRGLRNLAPSTFSATLRRDGTIDLHYGALGLVPANAVLGVLPSAAASAEPLAEVVARGTTEAVVEDYARRYRTFAHPRELGLIVFLLLSTGAVLTALPALLRSIVGRPVATLADGVSRTAAGARGVQVEVFYDDEIGRLASGFNSLSATLADREESLRSLNETLQQQVDAQTVELRAAYERLQAADQARRRVFANVSHEFRTPLTLLLGPMASLLDSGGLTEPQRHEVEGMRRNAERLLTLVNQVLDLARLDAGGFVAQPCAIDLTAWAAETAEAFGPMGERSGVEIEWQATLSHPARLADPDVLEKVVSNLLTNAIKFSPPGGRVRLRVEDALGSPEPEVCIAVEDEGDGIAPEAVENLFSRFFQRDNTRGGVGLGLALVRELTEACGGSVQVRTAPGAGSSFTVRLAAPWAENGAAPRSQTGHQRGMARLGAFPPDGGEVLNGEERARRSPDGAHRILIVDDHADVRAFLVRVLAPHYRTEQADSGEAALALLRTDPPDLVLTDIMMPGMNGHALLDAIRADAALRQVPVIVLTARADEAGRRAGLAAGVEDYLFKPFDPASLLARIENVLARRAELRDAHTRTVRIEATEVMVTDAQAHFLARVRDAVEVNLADPGLSVDRLAEAVGTSRRSLERAVSVAGETPLQLIRRLRMERAAQLLRGGHGTVKEVAGAVGYRHPGRFAADFRRVHGGNPSDFLRGTEVAD